ncbi:unnamed protein product [Camellia sinensis]
MILTWLRKEWNYNSSYISSRDNFPNRTLQADTEGGSVYFGVPVFSYTELEEATHNFDPTKELGDGGFGNIDHVYFLVYEYIPNGTVADHLNSDRANVGSLTWPIRMNIAIETASALAGFPPASDIIHCNIKTNNILLDNNFCVKVADFGLSRLFPNDYHQCYQLTDKSDVYSFGVMFVELISSMRAADITSHRQEINLANLAINRIQNRTLDELVDPTLGFKSDS